MLDQPEATPLTMGISYLVAEDCSTDPHALGQEDLCGPRRHIAGYRADDRSLILFVKTGAGENYRGPTATLFGSENRVEICPYDVTGP